MNNEQFRKLLGGDSKKSVSPSSGQTVSQASPSAPGALGSRQRSSIPMTPRSVGGRNPHNDFARQLAARNQAAQPQKKFRSSAPKGSRLADGYVDRSKERYDEEEDDRAKRIKALEEAYKKEEIDKATFEKLRNEIAGGDISSTHLVKGLDFKLLERIRRGEDVWNDKKDAEEEAPPPEEDVDEAFDEIEGAEVKTIEKKSVKKKGQMAPVGLVTGKKRTRDQILAEMKAARAAAKAAQEASLGDRFRKIGAKQKPGTRIERDSKGREVLIIVDEDGHEKRKVRKLQPEVEEEQRKEFIPDKDAKPLGMDVPEFYKKQQEREPEDDGDDIFADAGDDYNPLAGMDTSSSDDEDDEGEIKEEKDATATKEASKSDSMAMPPPPRPAAPRNYFKDSKTELISSQTLKAPSMEDPAIRAAFQRAAQLKVASKVEDDEDDEDDEAKARAARRKKMLESVDRDAEDLDMGFGTSRFEDEADFDDQPMKLSEWGNEDDDESRGGKAKRKRGPKKRKGDGNNAADVLRVMEQRKAAENPE